MKYLISSDEREAENNPLWREVAEGGIWDQEFMTHPPAQPTRALLLVCWVLPLSHHGPAPPALIKLPMASPPWWGRGAAAGGTLCSQAGTPGNKALCQRPNVQPHTTNHPNPCYSPFSICFCPSVLGGTKPSHHVFLMQQCIFLLWG